MTHDSARLSALVDGELDRETRERVLAHLAGCPQCRAIVDSERRLRGFLSGLAEYCTPGPSDEFLDGLLRLGRGPGDAAGAGAGGVAAGDAGASGATGVAGGAGARAAGGASDAGEAAGHAGSGLSGLPGLSGRFEPLLGSGDSPFGPAGDDDASTAQGLGGLPSTFPSSRPGTGFADFFPGSLPSAYADDSALLSDPDAARQALAPDPDGTSTRPVRQPLPSLAATDRSLRLAGTAAAFLDIVGSSRLRRRVTVGVVGAASVVGMTAALVFAVGPTTEDGPGPAPADVVSPARQLARNHTRGSGGGSSGTGTDASDGTADATATASPRTPAPTQPAQPGQQATEPPIGLPLGQQIGSSIDQSFVAPQVSGR